MSEEKKTLTVKPVLELKCVCGGTVIAGEFEILHTIPMCKKFEELEPADFVRWLRITLHPESETN